jgi:hypothetical protein
MPRYTVCHFEVSFQLEFHVSPKCLSFVSLETAGSCWTDSHVSQFSVRRINWVCCICEMSRVHVLCPSPTVRATSTEALLGAGHNVSAPSAIPDTETPPRSYLHWARCLLACLWGCEEVSTVAWINSVAWVRERTMPTERPPLSAKLVSTFADRYCHAVGVKDPYGRILGFLDRSRYFFFQVAPQLYSRGWLDRIPDPLLLRECASAGNRTRTTGSVARNSDY